MNEPFETRPEPAQTDALSGELVTEAFDYDDGRQVTVYVPPVPPKGIVFAGDAQMISQWARSLEISAAPPTVIVGVHRSADETLRLHEYSPKFEPKRFAAHKRFFAHGVAAWARSRFSLKLSVERTAVFGVSAGGELALALVIRHPEFYAVIFSPLLAQATGHLTRCRVDCLALTSWRARGNLSSLKMLLDGRPRCAMRMQMS